MRTALLLFGFGLALRLLLAHQAGASDLPWHPGYQGDAPIWQQLAHDAATGSANELFRVPLRPPGMQWLLRALWDGSPQHCQFVQGSMLAMGAALAPLLYLLLRQRGCKTRALAAGLLTAAMHPLLLLSSGPHNETPYLFLSLLAWFDQDRLQLPRAHWAAARWGALHGLLLLLRAEHLLVVAMLTLAAWRGGPRARLPVLACGWLCMALVIAPWQIHLAQRVNAYNTAHPPELPRAEQPLRSVRWDEQALAAVRALPTFQQAPVLNFVTDTVATRGGNRVTLQELSIVQDAYGCWPEPLRSGLICLYGPVNFFLANTPEADGGFSNAALNRAPPLLGGDSRYPPGLRSVLPQSGDLVLSYPPHLHLVLHGYRAGWQELWRDPFASLARIAKKYAHALRGAGAGFGGSNFPLGPAGERRAVDLTVALGWWGTLWALLSLTLATCGLWRLRHEAWLAPWLWSGLARLLVIGAYFGYARQGALLGPLVAIGLAACLPKRVTPRTLWTAALALLALEAGLTLHDRSTGTTAWLDQKPATAVVDHAAHQLHWR